jgi:transcriptional regulator of arginine metabolism
MSKLAIDNLSARRALIIELIEDGLIHSQTDLVKYLAKGGYKVTQATASRDLEELGAVSWQGFQWSFSDISSSHRLR